MQPLIKLLKGSKYILWYWADPQSLNRPFRLYCAEVRRVLLQSDGLGISGTNDLDLELLKEILTCTRDLKKLFAIHAGEKNRSDIEKALSLGA